MTHGNIYGMIAAKAAACHQDFAAGVFTEYKRDYFLQNIVFIRKMFDDFLGRMVTTVKAFVIITVYTKNL